MANSCRVLIAKLGLDGHDRGAKVITRLLREHGMTVYYSGIRKTPAQIVDIAIRNQVDLIGISTLSGAHLHIVPQLLVELSRQDKQFPVIVGGIIPEQDKSILIEKGVKRVFTGNESSEEIICYITRCLVTE